MHPVAINEMKSRSEILKEEHYKPLHQYLCSLISSLRKEADHFLEQRNFLDHVVQKKLTLGNTYSGNRESVYRSMFYFLEYTFFEDVEDEHGYRENDVQFGISVEYYIDDEIGLTRDISSDHEDIGYQKIAKCKLVTTDDFVELDKMKVDFLKVLGTFIDERA